MATSDYTDEDLYMHYRPYASDSDTALRIVGEHRGLYPLPAVDMRSDWTGSTLVDRERAALDSLKRAAASSDALEKQGLVDHAVDAMSVREAAAVKVSR